MTKNMETEEPGPRAKLKSPSPMLGKLRSWFLAGVLVTAPLGITVAVAWWFVDMVDSRIVPLIPRHLNPDIYLRETLGLQFGLPGFGVLVLLIGLTVIGALTTGLAGRYLIRMGEAILRRMPVLRSLYSGSKQILETVLQQQSDAFRQAVLVEYPRKGVWAFGFVTANTKGEVAERLAARTAAENSNQEDYISIYVPTTPNPTSGFLLFVPRSDIVALDMPVEDAFKMMVSMGILLPPTPEKIRSGKVSGTANKTQEAQQHSPPA